MMASPSIRGKRKALPQETLSQAAKIRHLEGPIDQSFSGGDIGYLQTNDIIGIAEEAREVAGTDGQVKIIPVVPFREGIPTVL